MNRVGSYPIVEVYSLDDLVAMSADLQNETIMGVVLHDAFDPSKLQPITKKLHAHSCAENAGICRTSRRKTEEFSGHTWLPVVNNAQSNEKRDLRILPIDVIKAATSIHAIAAETVTEAPHYVFVQEFRSKKDPMGLLHYDETFETSGLNMHITTYGEGILHLARLKNEANADRRQRIFYEPDLIHIPLMDSPFYQIPIRAGSIALFSAFGSQKPMRRKLLHKVETTSDFRVSATIDQIEPFRAADYSSGRILNKLRRRGIDIDAYLAA